MSQKKWKAVEQKESHTLKRRRRQEIIKLGADTIHVGTEATIQIINKTRSWIFVKINKKNKPLATQTKKHRDSIQLNKIRNEKGLITTETGEKHKIFISSFKSLYSTQLENVDEMDNFLDRY